ncbi:MAG: hypothetical protein EZS28_016980, partial [Streblomastix strix]
MEALNIWGKINQMLLIVIEMKDKELASGAMQIVREGIYSIIFQHAYEWNERGIIKSVNLFKDIINNSDDETCINLFDADICKSLRYIIEECDKTKEQSLKVKENAIKLIVSVAERGSLMSKDYAQNYFYDILTLPNSISASYIIPHVLYLLVQLIPAMITEDVNKIQQNLCHISAVMTSEALNLLQAMMAESFTITHQVFSEQNLMENIMDIAKVKKISLM